MTEQFRQIATQLKAVVVELATPKHVGTGICLCDFDLVVTGEHVVRDTAEVVIQGLHVPRQLVEVLYLDAARNLAFLRMPKARVPSIEFRQPSIPIGDGEPVLAAGHAMGQGFRVQTGQIAQTLQQKNGLEYLVHDALLDPAYSGGPLVDSEGRILGINTFSRRHGLISAMAIGASLVQQALESFKQVEGPCAARCPGCDQLVTAASHVGRYCPGCGDWLMMPQMVAPYEPYGLARTVEAALELLGIDVVLTRAGHDSWILEEGSARIRLEYHEQTGLLVGDAYLARLHRTDLSGLYQYLLAENYRLEGLSFSVVGGDIILSLIVYDRYFTVDSGSMMLAYLFQKADYYDNILVDEWGAEWIKR